MTNPFLTPLPDHLAKYGVIDFSTIEHKHYREAFDAGFRQQLDELNSITENPEAATFENTLLAFERSGSILNRVGGVFFNLTSSHTNDDIQTLQRELSPEYARHNAAIYTNEAFFLRIAAIRDGNEVLNPEQKQLVELFYTRFVRAGAALSPADRNKVNKLREELASLQTEFSQNVLKDTNAFELVLENEADLAGLPQHVRTAAKSEAESRGQTGKYIFTISRSSITPFLQFSERRDLREKIYKAYTDCGLNKVDNHRVIKKIAELRSTLANLLGFETFADYMLDDRMAKTPAAVNILLDQVHEASQIRVAQEAKDIQERIQEDGGNFEVEAWDWWYYTEKLREEKFSLDEEAVKPFFQLEKVRDGAFAVAGRLFGIRFEERTDIPKYHADVCTYEVIDSDDSLIGVFMVDFFMRPSKRGGAWMNEFRGQSNIDGRVRPVVVNCCNFPKADPCLLGMDEVRTLFHEFGHALHGLLSNVTYESLSGTSVKRDFVELPSQIMEHWALEPEVLKSYARHYKTDEPISDDMIARLNEAATFNQGFATTEYLAASYLDMAWHGLGGEPVDDVVQFEDSVMDTIEMPTMLDPRYKSSYFQHIFSSEGYAAGYYSYLWAEVLDADGYEAFKENGIFDAATALSFRQNILEKGGSVEPMDLYTAFRGRAPVVEPLLAGRGLSVKQEAG